MPLILGQGATDVPVEKWPKQYGLYLADGETPFPHDELPLVKALRGIKSRDVEMYTRAKGKADGRWLRQPWCRFTTTRAISPAAWSYFAMKRKRNSARQWLQPEPATLADA